MKFGFHLTVLGCFCVAVVRCQSSPCTTPNGESASCRSLLSCPILRNAIVIRDPSVEKFIQASALACGSGTLNVCCGEFANYTNVSAKDGGNEAPTTPESKREYTLKHILPSKTYCGVQHADDYFHDYNTSETTVDELPWVMYVSCEDGDSPMASSISTTGNYAITSRDCDCSGVLISKQYVLTATNCASAKWVGLGQREQYRNISCTPTPFGDDCSEAVTATPFTEQIRHPGTTLMLLRLNSKIQYSDYVRPICLPLEEGDRLEVGNTITTSKWEIDDKVRGFVRAKLNHTITTNDQCSYNFEKLELPNSSKYMCTRIENDETVLCKQDSGSPMMYKRNRNWFVGGILHSEACIERTAVGNPLTPDVVNWILENMKP